MSLGSISWDLRDDDFHTFPALPGGSSSAPPVGCGQLSPARGTRSEAPSWTPVSPHSAPRQPKTLIKLPIPYCTLPHPLSPSHSPCFSTSTICLNEVDLQKRKVSIPPHLRFQSLYQSIPLSPFLPFGCSQGRTPPLLRLRPHSPRQPDPKTQNPDSGPQYSET